MKVLFAQMTSVPAHHTYLPLLDRFAMQDRFHVHSVTTDPALADIILFIDAHQCEDWTLKSLLRHPWVKQYPEKTLVHNERDMPWCIMPGTYVSMPRATFNSRLQRAWSYLGLMNSRVVTDVVNQRTPDLLFSFMGAKTHTSRYRILKLSHTRAYIEDTSDVTFHGSPLGRDEQRVEQQMKRYAETISRSKFILCPCGQGSSSFRMYEVMAAGRVPVIVSDEWVAPSGPDWNCCSIRMPEAEIEKIPEHLEACEAQFDELAVQSLSAYAEWFAPDVMFHRLIDLCSTLLPLNADEVRACRKRLTSQYIRCCLFHANGRTRVRLGTIKRAFMRSIQ